MNKALEAFRARFPLPRGVVWNEHYFSVDSRANEKPQDWKLEAARQYQAMWVGFREAFKSVPMASCDDRQIYECTGCGTVSRNPDKWLETVRKAGAVSCCPERNIVPLDTGLTFAHFRQRNVERCEDGFFPLESKDGPWWGNAMAGECGEACNVIKKIDRDGMTTELLIALAFELADVVTYADLLAARYNIDLADAVKTKFNVVSARVKSEVKL